MNKSLGAEGRRGPKGEPGNQGEKGDPGSFDFLMLMVSDLRHDLEQLKSTVYTNTESPLVGEGRTSSSPNVSNSFFKSSFCSIDII